MTSSARILLIEDDREIATTIRSVLDAAGYNVQHAPNGKEGRRLVDEWQPDLVITDMMMPQMGGFPVLEYLRTLESPPRVIMITANEGGRHKAYAEMLGVDNYLRKPFAMDVMLEAIETALKKRKDATSKPSSAAASSTTVVADDTADDAEKPAEVEKPRRTTRKKSE